MKVKFIVDCEIEVIDSFDEALDDAESSTEVFRTGDECEFELLDHPEKLINGKMQVDKSIYNVQFPNGSVSFGLSSEWFTIIEK